MSNVGYFRTPPSPRFLLLAHCTPTASNLLFASMLLGESEPLEGLVHMPEVNLQ